MGQNTIPTAKEMAVKSEPIVNKNLQPALDYIAEMLKNINDRQLSDRRVTVTGKSLYNIYDRRGLSLKVSQLIKYLEDTLGYKTKIAYRDFNVIHSITLKW